MTKEKVSLTNDDWKALLPETVHTMGKTQLIIRPLNLAEVSLVLAMVDDAKETFSGLAITLENYTEPLHLIAIARLCVDKLPNVISDCAGLMEEDVKKLPLEAAVGLIRALIKANDKSKDGLVKNLEALTEELMAMMTDKEKTLGTQETSSSSSSIPDIAGKK